MVDPGQVTFFVNSDKETNERKRRPIVLTLRVPEQSLIYDAAVKLARKEHSLKQSQRKTHQK